MKHFIMVQEEGEGEREIHSRNVVNDMIMRMIEIMMTVLLSVYDILLLMCVQRKKSL